MNKSKAGIVFLLAAIVFLLTCPRCPAMPEVTKRQLPNQLKVLVFQEHSVPEVTLELLVGAGSSLDPQGMQGLANLTAKSLSLGTRDFSFEQINDKLDFMGATYGVECTRDFVTIDMQVLKKDLEAGVDLFTQIVEHPSFPSADVALEKDEIIGRMQEEEDNPLKIADRAFDKALFSGGPYAGSVQGGKKSVAGISAGQVAIFYASYYRPNNAVLVVGGDITPAEVKTKIIPKLLGWSAGPVLQPTFETASAKGAVRVDIDKPVSQAALVIGCSAMPRSSPDYFPFLVMNQILGSGDLSSRLMADIRTRRGLAYTVRSRLFAYKYAGSFRVGLRTENGSVREAKSLVQKELERLRTKLVSKAELKAAKEFLVGNFPLRYSLPGNFAKFLAEAEFYGLGADYMDKYPALIDSVTAGDIRRVAKKYLVPQNIVVVVGDLKRMSHFGTRIGNGSLPVPAPKKPVPVPPAAAPEKPASAPPVAAPKKPASAPGAKAFVGPLPQHSGKKTSPAPVVQPAPPAAAPEKPAPVPPVPAHEKPVPVPPVAAPKNPVPAPGAKAFVGPLQQHSGKKSPPASGLRPAPPAPAPEKPVPVPPASESRSAAISSNQGRQEVPALHSLEITADAKAWIRVTIDGRKTYSALLQPGQIRQWTAAKKVFLIVGNAGGVHIKWDGKPVQISRTPGRVIRLHLPGNGSKGRTRGNFMWVNPGAMKVTV